jgi:hypothetical protein
MKQRRKLAEDYGRAVLEIARTHTHSVALDLACGGQAIRLGFDSAVLRERFSPALQHLASAGDAHGLQIVLWEPNDASRELPPFPWPDDIYRACGEMPGFSEGDPYIHFDVPMGALSVLDLQSRHACYVCRAPQTLPGYECASPLRFLLHRFFVESGMAMVHAGAVARDGRAALITGPAGAGKSTTTLSCLAAGFKYLGDDRCLVQRNEGPVVWAVYSSAKIFAADIDRLPIADLLRGMDLSPPSGETKSIIHVDQVAPALMAQRADIACIITPTISAEPRSKLVEISSAEAAKLLIADIIGHSPTTIRKSLPIIVDICKRRPAFRLEAGRNLAEVAETVMKAIR